MPSRRVVLSYAAAEASGTPMVRSPFVDEVLRLLGDPARESAVRRIPASGVIPTIAECLSRDEFLARAAADQVLASTEAETIETRATLDSINARSAIERGPRGVSRDPDARRISPTPTSGDALLPQLGQIRARGRARRASATDARLARMLCGDPEAPKAWSATSSASLRPAVSISSPAASSRSAKTKNRTMN